MRETVKDLVKSSVISIGMAMTIFCLVGVVFDVGYKGNFRLSFYKDGCRMCPGRTGIWRSYDRIQKRQPSNANQSDHSYGNRMRGLYDYCLCRRMDRRFGHDRTGYPDCGNTACCSIFNLVPVHETLSRRGEKNE